ncbi:hypothetical protein KVD97_07170 [Helicobacter pylori]|nr:hypothetical protein [Helicobacter pylori]WRC00274.1 hypothetical protein KVD97_07170 [Helicobacter pylori]
MRKKNKNMRQTNETEKSFSKLKENTQAMREQKQRSITLTHKTELKPLTREPKKSVLEPKLKNILTP